HERHHHRRGVEQPRATAVQLPQPLPDAGEAGEQRVGREVVGGVVVHVVTGSGQASLRTRRYAAPATASAVHPSSTSPPVPADSVPAAWCSVYSDSPALLGRYGAMSSRHDVGSSDSSPGTSISPATSTEMPPATLRSSAPSATPI